MCGVGFSFYKVSMALKGLWKFQGEKRINKIDMDHFGKWNGYKNI